MKKNELKNLFIVILLILTLFFAVFNQNIITRQILSIIILVFTLFISLTMRKVNIDSIYKKHVLILLNILSLVYVALFYLLGLYFGFVRSKVILSMWSINRFIIPLSIIIVCSEIIRYKLLSNQINFRLKSIKINVMPFFIFISMVIIDLLIYTGVYDLTNINDFLTAIGFVLFASISCNLLFNYLSIRYGNKGIIIYRLVTILYIYIIPVTPDVFVFFSSFFRMIYPYFVYLIIEKFFSNYDFVIARSTKSKEFILNSVTIVVTVCIMLLVSCKFKYGILVIGSGSMTGSINKGDAIIYESYDSQVIQNGQIIVFDYNNSQTIHRVIDIREVNGEIRYFTKGDANKSADENYRTKSSIIGITRLRIKGIGYPTLWLRNLFSN